MVGLLGGCASWKPKGIDANDYWRPQAGSQTLGVVVCDIGPLGAKVFHPEYSDVVVKRIEDVIEDIDASEGKLVMLKRDDPMMTAVCDQLKDMPEKILGLISKGFDMDLLPYFKEHGIDMLMAGYGRYDKNLETDSVIKYGQRGDLVGGVASVGIGVGEALGKLPLGMGMGGGYGELQRFYAGRVTTTWLLTNYKGTILARDDAAQKGEKAIHIPMILKQDARDGYAAMFQLLKRSPKPLALVNEAAPSPQAAPDSAQPQPPPSS